MNGMPMLVTGLAWVVAVRTVMFCLDPYLKSISCSSWPILLATSKSGTLLLRRDQGDVAALLDSGRCRL